MHAAALCLRATRQHLPRLSMLSSLAIGMPPPSQPIGAAVGASWLTNCSTRYAPSLQRLKWGSMANNPNAAPPQVPRPTWTYRLYRAVVRLFTVIGVITMLTIATPLVHWWAIASLGPIEQPKGDI